jgi:hypothetical protein
VAHEDAEACAKAAAASQLAAQVADARAAAAAVWADVLAARAVKKEEAAASLWQEEQDGILAAANTARKVARSCARQQIAAEARAGNRREYEAEQPVREFLRMEQLREIDKAAAALRQPLQPYVPRTTEEKKRHKRIKRALVVQKNRVEAAACERNAAQEAEKQRQWLNSKAGRHHVCVRVVKKVAATKPSPRKQQECE